MFSLAFLSHLVSDFIFQSSKMIHQKQKKLIRGNFYHGLIVLFINILFFGFYMIYTDSYSLIIEIIAVALLITCVHFILDVVKTLILKKIKKIVNWDLSLFLLDQFLHLTAIYLIIDWFGVFDFNFDFKAQFYIHVFIIYILTIVVGDYTIQRILKSIKNNVYEKREKEIKGIGSYIGKIERAIILTMLIFDHPEVAIAIIGIKSIARFPEMNKSNESNDYFILGNLLSLLIVIIGYILYMIFIGENILQFI